MQKGMILFLLLILSISSVFAATSCPPGIPKTYYGIVQFNNTLLTGNYEISAPVSQDSVDIGNVTNGHYSIDISPCYGSSISNFSFYVGRVQANQLGFYAGTNDWGVQQNLNLTLDTMPVTSSTCEDGIKDPWEACDTNDYGGLTCSSYGFNSGILRCSNLCNQIYIDNCQSLNNNGGNNGGGNSGGGGGGGGGSPSGSPSSGISTTTPLNSAISTSIPNESTKNIDLTGNNIPPGIGLSILDFAKSGAGLTIGGIFIVILLVIGVIVLKKRSPKNEKLQ